MRAVLEAGAVLVVRIDQQNAQVGARLHDLAQDQRDRARLAGTGAAEDREVLAHGVVDVDIGAERVVLLQMSDIDRVGTGGVEDDPQLLVPDRNDDAADARIEHDAALEISAAGLLVEQLAEQIDLADRGRAALAVGRFAERDFAERADHQRTAVPDAEKAADGNVRIVLVRREELGRELHDDLRAGDRNDAPERLGRIHGGRSVIGKPLERLRMIGHSGTSTPQLLAKA